MCRDTEFAKNIGRAMKTKAITSLGREVRASDDIFKDKQGIRLDIGCGGNCTPNWVGMDIRPIEGIDIVHDVQIFPWPIPDNIVLQAICSHLWEHIEPKNRIKFMDEIWRVMKNGGQLLLSAPYASSFGASQDPTHYPCPNEATFTYFDPKEFLYTIYKPKPWRIKANDFRYNGNLEVIMEAIKDEG
jgi:SAM-dependent methyltransferase